MIWAGGGIGIRATLRSLWGKTRAGSSPVSPTKKGCYGIKMKTKVKYLVLLIFFFIFPIFLFPKNAKAQSETIKNYNVDININKNGTLDVIEQIVYDFGNQQKHGIFRDINFKKTNQDGKRFKLGIENITVKNTDGTLYQFEKSKSGDFINLKIGDPNRTITGIHTYIISYTVSGAITYFSDHDELYWNITGNNWPIPIESSYSLVSLPEEINLESVNVVCYEGVKGSTSQTCLAGKTDGGVLVSSSRVLQSKEGLTLAVSFPKGVVSILEPVEDKPSLFTYVILLFLLLIGLWWFLFLPIKILFKSIKEKKFVKDIERIVAAWFEPPQYNDGTVFTPAETGFIIDKTIDHKELTATIIHLAQRGFLKIRSDEKKHFTFIKMKDFETLDLRNFEKEVLRAIFEKGDEVKDTDLKNSSSFFNKITTFKKYVEEDLVEKKMFEEKPTSVETLNMIFFGLGLTTFNLFLAIVAFFWGRKSAKRTLEGVEKYSEAKSLFNFLKSQDEQLNFQSKNQMFFEKLLPYAAGFGVEKIWADRFKDISVQKPDWYEGDDFTNIMFISALTSNIGGSMKSSMTPTRSSSGFSSGFSGGGSSGGGGGGGGGGSW